MKKIFITVCLLALSTWAMADNEDLLYKAYLDSIARVEQLAAAKAQAAQAAAQARQDSIDELRAARRAAAQLYLDSINAAEQQRLDSIMADSINSAVTDTVAQDSTRELDRFTIGVRAGAASMLQELVNKDAKSKFGFDVLLDLQYAHYWQTKKEHKLGLLTGVSFGIAQGGLNAVKSTDQYTVTDPDGMKASYTVTADNIKETDRQLQLEVPLMFSLISKQGIFFNFGPRFFLPVYTPYKATMENPNIDAYFEQTDVHVTNEVITGLMKDNQVIGKGKTNNNLKLNITLGTELGYEWQLKNGHSLGLGAYANYGLYSMFKQDAQNKKSLVTVTPSIPSTVSTNSATEAWTQKMGFVDVGVKLAYHFNWWKTKKK